MDRRKELNSIDGEGSFDNTELVKSSEMLKIRPQEKDAKMITLTNIDSK